MDLIFTVILAIACILIGIMISSLFHTLRSGKQERKAELSVAGLEEVAKILRDPSDGKMVLGIGSLTFHSADDLHPEDRQKLAVTAIDLRDWLGIFPAQSTPVEESPVSRAAFENAPVSLSELTANRKKTPEVQEEKDRPAINPFSIFTDAIPERDKAIPEEPKSIVAQIDDILQHNLEGTPLASRGIRLVELPQQGMVVMIGLEKYDEVDAIPEAEIRDIIHQAVEEWENRFGGV